MSCFFCLCLIYSCQCPFWLRAESLFWIYIFRIQVLKKLRYSQFCPLKNLELFLSNEIDASIAFKRRVSAKKKKKCLQFKCVYRTEAFSSLHYTWLMRIMRLNCALLQQFSHKMHSEKAILLSSIASALVLAHTGKVDKLNQFREYPRFMLLLFITTLVEKYFVFPDIKLNSSLS